MNRTHKIRAVIAGLAMFLVTAPLLADGDCEKRDTTAAERSTMASALETARNGLLRTP
jgi:hypothetical protein